MAGHFLHLGVSLAHGIQLLAQFDIRLGMGEAHLAAVALVVVQTDEGVVVFESQVAVVNLFEGLYGEVVV